MAGRARAELAAKNNAQLQDSSWQVWKNCGYCGRSIMTNNYSDRKARTPKMFGLIICPWCEPRYMDDRWLPKGEKPRIYSLVKYRTIASTVIARRVSKLPHTSSDIGVEMKAIIIQAQKFWDHGHLPVQN